jgi:putative spermidine/putrescine transport system substrate-binding protein
MPSKLSDERKRAALEFIDFAMSAKANAQNYKRFNVPTNKNATVDILTAENKEIYEKGIDVVPELFKDGDEFIIPEDNWILFPDSKPLTGIYDLWEDKIQSAK